MLWRRLSLVRALSAASLFVVTAHAADNGQPALPETETVKILDARKSGELKVDLRGGGEGKALMSLTNTSAKRLNVVLPPGLVGSNVVGQRGGAGGGRGGQSVGLGPISTPAGGFGGFQAPAPQAGFRSVAVTDTSATSVTVPAGQTVELTLPALCLNYGLKTPTSKDKLELVDVEDYTRDVRVRKTLRSLATYGTSFGVAQAALWNVANGLSFDLMAQKAGSTAKGDVLMNLYEVALAAKFVDAVDTSSATDLVDPATLAEGRIFITVEGDNATTRRLLGELEGVRVLGMPVRVVSSSETPTTQGPAIHLAIVLNSAEGKTQGKILVRTVLAGEWTVLGNVPFVRSETLANLTGEQLATTTDRVIASAFVKIKAAKRSSGATTFRVDNRLPFTLAKVVVRTGESSGSPRVDLVGVAVGPGRSAITPAIPAANATIERVELNGL